MLEWLLRGMRQGRITTRYPPPRSGRPASTVPSRWSRPARAACWRSCARPARSPSTRRRGSLDRARCILCGECVRVAPERFRFAGAYGTAARTRAALVVTEACRRCAAARDAGEAASALRRSIHVRHIDCGSDGSEEWEIQALWNPYYDIQRLGFFLTDAPRHADVLMVTGGVTAPMRAPLERTWEVMPGPKALVAVGTEACSGALAAQGASPPAASTG